MVTCCLGAAVNVPLSLMAQSHQALAGSVLWGLCDSEDSALSSVIITTALKIWIPYRVLTHINILLSNIRKLPLILQRESKWNSRQ